MNRTVRAVLGVLLLLAAGTWGGRAQAQALNPLPPETPVRLVFVHHSVGEGWLADDNGNLLQGLNDNNYYVTDTNYGWGPADADVGDGTIGDHTDTGHWYNWFLGPHRDTYLSQQTAPLGLFPNLHLTDWIGSNSIPKPAGNNRIIMFKSCYPNSGGISGNPDDPPRQSSPGDPNPLWGASAYDGPEVVNVSNIKGLYRDLLAYFATRQDKLFILITPPPVTTGDQFVEGSSSRARAINTWLVHHWLDGYRYDNVAVFDFFNVLTSNGGDVDTNDLGAAGGNHHRLRAGQVEHVIGRNQDLAAYPSGDSHPTPAGGQKATGEFLPLLNVAYHAWQGDGGRPWHLGRSPKCDAALHLLLLD